jgi:ribonuclease HI
VLEHRLDAHQPPVKPAAVDSDAVVLGGLREPSGRYRATSPGARSRRESYRGASLNASPLPEVELWTDGSGTTRQQPGGWAFVLRYIEPGTGEVHEREGHGRAHYATNNTMEMTALLEGLRSLPWPCRVKLHADSELVGLAFDNRKEGTWTEGRLAGWKKRGWRRTQGRLRNEGLWREIDTAAQGHVIEFVHVRGHTGIALNERCDVLAGEQRKLAMEEVASGNAPARPLDRPT